MYKGLEAPTENYVANRQTAPKFILGIRPARHLVRRNASAASLKVN